MADNLFPDGDFTFVEGGGKTLDDRGKVHWPALLRLELSENRAWSLAKELISMLSDSERTIEDRRLILQITFVGAIERHADDRNRLAMDGSDLEATSND